VAAWLADPRSLAAAAGLDRSGARLEAAAAVRRARLAQRDVDRQEERLARHATRGELVPRAVAVRAAEIARLRAQVEHDLAAATAQVESEERMAAQAGEVEARVAALRDGLDRAGFDRWRQVVEVLFPAGSVLLWPDGRIELRGLLPLEGALSGSGQPSAPSRRAGRLPVSLEAWATRRR